MAAEGFSFEELDNTVEDNQGRVWDVVGEAELEGIVATDLDGQEACLSAAMSLGGWFTELQPKTGDRLLLLRPRPEDDRRR